MQSETYINLSVLQSIVSNRLGREVSRRTFYRWRQHLGITEPPYVLEHADCLVCFGKLVGVGTPANKAYEVVLEKFGA